MLTKHSAIILLKWWASSQNREVKRLDYPTVTPGFEEHQSGYRELATEAPEDSVIETVGLAISRLHPAAKKTIKKSFLNHKKVPRKTRDWAVVTFARELGSVSE